MVLFWEITTCASMQPSMDKSKNMARKEDKPVMLTKSDRKGCLIWKSIHICNIFVSKPRRVIHPPV